MGSWRSEDSQGRVCLPHNYGFTSAVGCMAVVGRRGAEMSRFLYFMPSFSFLDRSEIASLIRLLRVSSFLAFLIHPIYCLR